MDALRKSFTQEMGEIDSKVVQLFALVTESLAAATDSLLSGDRDIAMGIKERDKIIDVINDDIQEVAERALLLQAPVASDLRFLLSVLRIVPELERSGDLAEHIASRAARGLGGELTPAVRGLVERMGNLGVSMWRAAADAYADRDGEAAARIDEVDDELDALHDELAGLLEGGELPMKPALEMALVARFYERLGDHALHISERVSYLAGVR
ncbi:MAG TPA: phosphate signaling complex protein PhoU [Acidimicrobiales bacterium]|nr:phosphate signaling complex protein PhoU [Acidimicrobiales bacterium]